jgi:hypothetical protein
MAELKDYPKELRSTQVLVRFCLRMIILAVFASFGSIGFARSFVALLGDVHHAQRGRRNDEAGIAAGFGSYALGRGGGLRIAVVPDLRIQSSDRRLAQRLASSGIMRPASLMPRFIPPL